MRALRVLGATEDDHVICTDTETGEKFSLAVDADLRAAVRGQSRPSSATARPQGRPTAEEGGESLLRPAEIQQRIRAGESAEQVAQAAGTTVARIERFAYPVLLERSTMADRGRKAVAVIAGATSRRTLEDLVAAALGARGQGGALGWDAHRGPDGWVLTLRWQAGRSENRAQWAMHAGPGSGTVTALDDAADQLLDPTPQPLRTIDGAPRVDPMTAPAPGSHHPALHNRSVVRPAAPTPSAVDTLFAPAHPAGPAPAPVQQPSRAAEPSPARGSAAVPASVSSPVSGPAAPVSSAAVSRQGPVPTAGAVIPAESVPPVEPARASAPRPRSMLDSMSSPMARTGTDSTRRTRPAMPSWDDVLLGGSGH